MLCMKKSVKSKIKVNKLEHNPLFIRFLNWGGDKYFVEETLDRLAKQLDEASRPFAVSKKDNLSDNYLNELSSFLKVFKDFLSESISKKDVSEQFVSWMGNSFKYITEEVSLRHKGEDRKITIKDPDGRWLEAILCHNFIMTHNYFGIEIMKICPVCKSFFCHKGRYARYCSDGCKEKGMKKK